MKYQSKQLIKDGTMTGTTTITSIGMNIQQVSGYCVQAYWTGTPVGAIKLQGSCGIPPESNTVSSDAMWEDIEDSSYSIAGVAGSKMWDISDANYSEFRVVYVNASSTGVLSAHATLKEHK